MAHISDHPAALEFLTNYWWETADLVYGEGGITAATQQYVEDHAKAGDGEGASQRLSADLMRLMTTEFVGEPDWESADYRSFWQHPRVHRALVADDIKEMLGALRLGSA